MNCSPATFRRDGSTSSARASRERKARPQQLRRPRTVAVAEHEQNVNKAVPAEEKNTWLQRAKVYEKSFVAMKNRNAVKKEKPQGSHIPQAYDIEEHLDCGQGIVVIGKNGVVTNDQYYVKCMKRSSSRPEPSTGSDVDSSFLSSEDESSKNDDMVPLCWQQQLEGKDMVRNCTLTLLFIVQRILTGFGVGL